MILMLEKNPYLLNGKLNPQLKLPLSVVWEGPPLRKMYCRKMQIYRPIN